MKKPASLTVATLIAAAILAAFAIACTSEPTVTERIVEVEVTRQVTVETVIEKEVVKEVPVEKVVVQQIVETVPVEVVVEREVVKEIPVEKLVVKEVVETVLVEVVVEREVVKEIPVETVTIQQVVVTATPTPTPVFTPTPTQTDASIPDVEGGHAIIRDIFGRAVNETGIVLVDWEGHIANPLMTYSVEFPAGVTFPTRVFLASDESRLIFDLPSQFGVNGPSKVVRLAGESPAGDFRITIFPDRDTADETHSLTLQYVDDNNERRSQTIDIHVVDQDRERPLEFNIIADFSYDKSGLFDNPVARATAQQGADDWAYFFADMNLDTVAAGEEMMWINDPGPWGIGKYETNTYAYNGFLLQIYAQPNDGQGNGANASHDPDNQSSQGVRLPLKRSGIYHYDPRGNGNTNGWLTDPLDSEWWKAHDQSKPADLYSGVIHEGGHAIVFNRGHDGMAVFMDAGEISDPVVRAYFGSNPKIDEDAHLKGIDPASGRGIFGNGNIGYTFNGRTLPKKTDLLVAQAAGYKLRETSPFIPLSISTDPLPEAKPGEEYNHTIDAIGGIPAYHWAIDSGELPEGLSLDSFTGAISGTPIDIGTFNFTIRLRDQTNGHAGVTRSATLSVVN